MIHNESKIAVAVSGGKDSLLLLCVLAEMRRFYPNNYDLMAITLDPCFNNRETDFSKIEELCKKLNVPYNIIRSDLSKIIFEERKEENPCSLCARMRRGILHNESKKENCTHIALGHNLDDAVETFFMNLLNCGSINCFSPKSYLSRKDLILIRPLIFCEEREIRSICKKYDLPVVKSECPVDGHTNRQRIKELVDTLNKDYRSLKNKTIGAIERAHISDW